MGVCMGNRNIYVQLSSCHGFGFLARERRMGNAREGLANLVHQVWVTLLLMLMVVWASDPLVLFGMLELVLLLLEVLLGQQTQ